MAIGIKSTALVGCPCKLHEARYCPSCEIVTERELCPLCETTQTVRHPELLSDPQRGICVECGDEMPHEFLRVKTWSFAPYDQCEGDLVCMCRICFDEYVMSDDPNAVWRE